MLKVKDFAQTVKLNWMDWEAILDLVADEQPASKAEHALLTAKWEQIYRLGRANEEINQIKTEIEEMTK